MTTSEKKSRSKSKGIKKQLNSIMYDRLFSIYLTPKAFDEIKSKADNFAKVVSDVKKQHK